MASRRVKISFSTVNGERFNVIKKSDIAETNQRVKEKMKPVVRDYEKKETRSQQEAALLVLNS